MFVKGIRIANDYLRFLRKNSMSRVDNITLKIILLITIIIVFFRTMSVKRTRELKEFVEKFLKDEALSNLLSDVSAKDVFEKNEMSEKASDEQKLEVSNEAKSFEESEKRRELKLDEKTRDYIIRTVSKRHYQSVKKKLEKMGYTNVRIQKVRSLIIIETNEGKTVLTINENTP